jgi:hypothetical protein
MASADSDATRSWYSNPDRIGAAFFDRRVVAFTVVLLDLLDFGREVCALSDLAGTRLGFDDRGGF